MSVDEKALLNVLPLYYRRLFPVVLFKKWLCYGNTKNLNKREVSFTLPKDKYLRYLSFDTTDELLQALLTKTPTKIDVGAIYLHSLKQNFVESRIPVEKEVVIDIDLTDYDDIRTCCSGADLCLKCWKFMSVACKILDVSLRDDFGFEHILWVFSGRRGIHCWIADKKARLLENHERLGFVNYFGFARTGLGKKVISSKELRYGLKRDLAIIDEQFESVLVEQDILGTNERLDRFLKNIHEDLRKCFHEPMSQVSSSHERWAVFQQTYQHLARNNKIPNTLKHLIEEIKFYYLYPRLDMHVTQAKTHLLKAPFSVHPKTGKIAVPFEAKDVHIFNPNTSPTIWKLREEVADKDEVKMIEDLSIGTKNPEYNNTSLRKHVHIFREFLKELQEAAIKARQQ